MSSLARGQRLRTFVYSSIAIAVLTLVWGLRQIPQQADLAKTTLKTSLEQELLNLNSAAKSGVQAMRFRLLDVLKAEGNDHATRAFQESPFFSASLLEWDQTAWKPQWYSTKGKDELTQAKLQELMKAWPLSKLGPEDVYFTKIGDIQGQPHFAVLVPVRRVSQTPLIGVGIFPAAQFGLIFSAASQRESRVFTDKGDAIALSRASYLGASVRSESLPSEILEADEVSTRKEWKSENGDLYYGIASRLPGSNLFTSIETKEDFGNAWFIKSWLYLIFVAAAGVALNWWLFNGMFKPLLDQLSQADLKVEQLRKQQRPSSENPIPNPKLADHDFLEENRIEIPAPVPASAAVSASVEADQPSVTSLDYVVTAALRSLGPKLKENRIETRRNDLDKIQLEADPLQLQTALEEILKNSIEAMSAVNEDHPRILTIKGEVGAENSKLTIEDTGSGIPNENVSKVFDPFYSTKDSEGVARGLGLNVARRVVEELKGQIKLQSRHGGIASGTKVVIEWPLSAEAVAANPLPKVKVPLERSKAVSDAVAAALSAVRDIEDRDFAPIAIRKPKVRTLD
jgi:anti-sigma regulatory factor (Ser/Thr protein kinase)